MGTAKYQPSGRKGYHPTMIYRKLGRTGLDISAISLGCEYVWHSPQADVQALVDRALDAGMNYIDLFIGTPQTRANFGQALKGRREKVLLAGHIGSADRDGQYFRTRDPQLCEQFIQEFYQNLQTDYIDVLFLHNCNSLEDYQCIFAPGGIYERALSLQKEGRARYIGMSSHSTAISLKAVESGLIDVLMYPINPLFDLLPGDTGIAQLTGAQGADAIQDAPSQQSLYEACQAHHVGLVGMKPFAGGSLLGSRSGPLDGLLSLTPVQCIHYALTRPGVSAIVPGFKNTDELDQALAYLSASEAERSLGSLEGKDFSAMKGQCMYCNHCQPCPVGIDIAETTKLADQAERHGLTDALRASWAALTPSAAGCLSCGSCSKRCPFGIDAMANIHRAAALFK